MFIRQSTDNEQAARWRGLQQWYRQPLGQRFGAAESGILQEMLPLLFGYYLIALGEPLTPELLQVSPVSRRWLMGLTPEVGRQAELLLAPEQLPIATDSVDVLVLSHVLEFSRDPVATLKEVDRVLIAEGYAIILGFNPLSLWGLWYALGGRHRRREHPFNGADVCSVSGLRSWLALLGLETVAVHYHSYRPPLRESSTRERSSFMESIGQRHCRSSGGGYILLAKKRVSTLTLLRPRWFGRHPASTEGIAASYEADPWGLAESPLQSRLHATNVPEETN